MVATIAGNQADIGFALQASQGAGASAAQYRAYLTAGGLGATKGTEDVAETAGLRLRSDAFVTRVAAEGAPQMAVRPRGLGLLLYAAMGAKAVSGSADPWTHTFTLASVLPYLTFWSRIGPAASGGKYEKFVDCKVGQLVIASQAGGLMLATATILGLQPSFLTAAEVSVAVEGGPGTQFLHADGAGALLVEGAAVTTIEAFELSLNNNAAVQQGDAVNGYAISEALEEIVIRTTQAVSDFALWNRFMYGSATPSGGAIPTRDILELAGSPAGIDYKFTRPGSPERSLEVLAPRVEAIPETIVPNVNGDPLKFQVSYRVKQPSSGSGLTAKVKNDVSAYT